MKPARTVTIVLHDDDGGFSVVDGENVADKLNFEEMLGEVIRLASPGQSPRYMRTPDQIVAGMERQRRHRRELDRQSKSQET